MGAELKISDIVQAEVTKITDFGAFVKINGRTPGLIHISQIADSFVKDINEHLKTGDKVKARVIKLGPGNKIDLSLKSSSGLRSPRNNSGAARSSGMRRSGFPPRVGARRAGFKSSDFEEKLKKFLQQS